MDRRTHLPLTPTFLDGLLLATNAMPDLALVIDCANCGDDKFSMFGGLNDFGSTLCNWDRQQRARYSSLKATDMVFGTEKKLRESVLELISHRHPRLVMLVQSSAVRLIGSDHESVAQDLEAETGIAVASVPLAMSGDWLDGYSAALEVLANKLPLTPPHTDPQSVGILGYLFERFEQDHQGNVRELRRMVEALGYNVPSVWLDGCETDCAVAMTSAATLLALPEGRRAATRIAKRTGASVVECSLPIGIQGTVEWMRSVGKALGAPTVAEQFIERELDRTIPRLDKVVRRTFAGKSAAVIGDPLLVQLLSELCAEFGVAVRLAAILSRKPSAAEQMRNVLDKQGHTPQLLLDPTFPDINDAFRTLANSHQLDFVIGSGGAHDAAKPLGVPYVEVAHPCYVRHALFDAPWMGFHGVLWIADTLFNLLNERDYCSF